MHCFLKKNVRFPSYNPSFSSLLDRLKVSSGEPPSETILAWHENKAVKLLTLVVPILMQNIVKELVEASAEVGFSRCSLAFQ